MTQTPIQRFFESSPLAKDIFDAFVVELLSRIPDTSIQIHPEQIALISVKPFAAIWLPTKEIPKQSDALLILSFGLGHSLSHPRIFEVSQPYPHRYMHHILIKSPQQFDETLMDWLNQARDFSLKNTRKKAHEH